MNDINAEHLDYPQDAAQVRDLIRDMMQTQVDHGTSMDTGGGLGSADLWMKFGGKEYFISVQGPKKA